jgi:hypothetical protein
MSRYLAEKTALHMKSRRYKGGSFLFPARFPIQKLFAIPYAGVRKDLLTLKKAR